MAYFRHQGEEVPKRKAGVKLGPMSSETQGTILQPGLHGKGIEEIVRTRHEAGTLFQEHCAFFLEDPQCYQSLLVAKPGTGNPKRWSGPRPQQAK